MQSKCIPLCYIQRVLAWLIISCALSGSTDVEAHLRERGVPPSAIVLPHRATPAMQGWVDKHLATQPPHEQPQQLYQLLLAEKRAGRLVADKDNSPKARAPKTATDMFALMHGAPGDKQAGCYEFTVLYVALARAAGLDAVGVERDSTVGTGQVGHVLAGVRTARGLELFDLQNDTNNPRMAVRVLDDFGLVAHHYNHLAVAAHLAGNFLKSRDAIDVALLLAPDAPAFLSNRAMALLALRELHLALADAAQVVQLEPAVALYRFNLGSLMLASGLVDEAILHLRYALQLNASYGLARRDLGWALLLRHQADAAQKELELAAQARPTVPDAYLYLGLLHLARGNKEAALKVVGKSTESKLLALATLAEGQKPVASIAADVALLQQVLKTVQQESNP